MGRQPKMAKPLALFLAQTANASGFIALNATTLRRKTLTGALYYRIADALEPGHVTTDAVRAAPDKPSAWPRWPDIPEPGEFGMFEHTSIDGGPESAALAFLAAQGAQIQVTRTVASGVLPEGAGGLVAFVPASIVLFSGRGLVVGPLDEWSPDDPAAYALPESVLPALELGAHQYQVTGAPGSDGTGSDGTVAIDTGHLRLVEPILPSAGAPAENLVSTPRMAEYVEIVARDVCKTLGKKSDAIRLISPIEQVVGTSWSQTQVRADDLANALRVCGKSTVRLGPHLGAIAIEHTIADGWHGTVLVPIVPDV